MSLLIESICLLNGEIRNANYHEARMHHAGKEIFGGVKYPPLEELIAAPDFPREKFKCRILYDKETLSVEVLPYEIREIHTFKIMEFPNLDYSFKWADRQVFERLKELSGTDEIILTQDGKITDTSFSNLLFFDGKEYITPADCLLPGTMRQFLLDSGRIKAESLEVKDLKRFRSFQLINAMLSPEESPLRDLSEII